MEETVPKWRDPRLIGLALWGAAAALCGFPPAGGWPLALVAPAPLFAAATGASPRGAFKFGFVFGVGWFGGLVWWLVHTLGVYGNIPWVAGLAVTCLLVFYLALYPALCGWLMARAARRRPAAALAVAPFAWTGLEWVRGTLMTGFPWGDLPQALWRVEWALDLAPWVGMDGVRLLTASLAAALAWAWLRFGPDKRRLAAWSALPAALFAPAAAVLLVLGSPTPQGAEQVRVAVVQGNIPQHLKWGPEFKRRTMEIYARLTRETLVGEGADFVLWPETAVPLWIQEPSAGRTRLEALAREVNTPLVFGAPAYVRGLEGEVRHRNGVFVIDAEGRLAPERHEKVHLVPFGEFVPFGKYLPFIKRIVTAAGDFSPGDRPRPVQAGRVRVGPLICFESVFSPYAVDHARQGAQMLGVVTNDAWFGDTPAPWHHLAYAAWRAAETGLPVVRAANTGVSGAFDARGRLKAVTGLMEATGFVVELGIPPRAHAPGWTVRPWVSPLSLLLALGVVFGILRHRSDDEGGTNAQRR